MAVLKLHHVVVVQPRANVQFARRINGIAHAVGCRTDVVVETTAFAQPLGDLSQTTAIYQAACETDDAWVPSVQLQKTIEWYQHKIPDGIAASEAKWHCVGNPITSPHTPLLLRTLSTQVPDLDQTCQSGWGHFTSAIECSTHNLVASLLPTIESLRLQNTPNVKGFLDTIIAVQKIAPPESQSQMQLWCDGASLSFKWLVSEPQMDALAFSALLSSIDSAFHMILSSKDPSETSISISGHHLICPETAPTQGIILVGQCERFGLQTLLQDLEESA